MYIIIRRLKVQSHLWDEVLQRMENGYVPILKNKPEFVEFYGVIVEDEGVSISVFETQQAAEEANRQAREPTRYSKRLCNEGSSARKAGKEHKKCVMLKERKTASVSRSSEDTKQYGRFNPN